MAPPTIEVKAGEDGFNIVISVRRPSEALPTLPIPFSVEPINIGGKLTDIVDESNLLGSGYAHDLDGDGKLAELSASCRADHSLQIKETHLQPLVGDIPGVRSYFDARGNSKIVQVGTRGIHMLGYFADCEFSTATIGMFPDQESTALAHVPGPVLQLIVLERVANAQSPETSILETKSGGGSPATYRAHSYQAATTKSPAWHVVRWQMLPLTFDGDESLFSIYVGTTPVTAFPLAVLARVNTSDRRGVRYVFPATKSLLQVVSR